MSRHATPEQQDRADDNASARYDELFAEIEAAERAEHEREFGLALPFKPDGARVHAKVMQRLQQEP